MPLGIPPPAPPEPPPFRAELVLQVVEETTPIVVAVVLLPGLAFVGVTVTHFPVVMSLSEPATVFQIVVESEIVTDRVVLLVLPDPPPKPADFTVNVEPFFAVMVPFTMAPIFDASPLFVRPCAEPLPVLLFDDEVLHPVMRRATDPAVMAPMSRAVALVFLDMPGYLPFQPATRVSHGW